MKVVKRKGYIGLIRRSVTDVDGLITNVLEVAYSTIFNAQDAYRLEWKPLGKKWDLFETTVVLNGLTDRPVRVRVILRHAVVSGHFDEWQLLLASKKAVFCLNSSDERVRRLVNRVAGPEYFPDVE